jgi:hypothetical protein
MNIDKAIDIAQNVICDEVICAYCTEIRKEEVNCSKNCENQDCYLVQAIENLINEYSNLKQIEEAHRIENGELRERINKIEKYVRGNEWSEDYKNSSCRTRILRILEED